MKLNELLLMDDVKVNSSWINTLDYDEQNNVLMRLKNGTAYIIKQVPEELYNRWLRAPTKGKFWHANIKQKYEAVKHF